MSILTFAAAADQPAQEDTPEPSTPTEDQSPIIPGAGYKRVGGWGSITP